MKADEQIREHIFLLEKAVEFMEKNKDKGAKDEWIQRWRIYAEVLKWVVDEPSEYEEVYENIEMLKR